MPGKQAAGALRPGAERELVGPWAGRLLYNLADALRPEHPRDLVPAAARLLRHRGPGAVRRLHLWLVLLEWEPLLAGRMRRRFWRLPREERVAACARSRGSRFVWRRRAWAELSAWVEDALAQSSEGA
jgi:hypothetical protein